MFLSFWHYWNLALTQWMISNTVLKLYLLCLEILAKNNSINDSINMSFIRKMIYTFNAKMFLLIKYVTTFILIFKLTLSSFRLHTVKDQPLGASRDAGKRWGEEWKREMSQGSCSNETSGKHLVTKWLGVAGGERLVSTWELSLLIPGGSLFFSSVV